MYIIKCKLVTKTIGGRVSEEGEKYHPEYGIATDLDAVETIFKKKIGINGVLIIDDKTHAHSAAFNDGGSITWAEYTAVPVEVV